MKKPVKKATKPVKKATVKSGSWKPILTPSAPKG